MIRRVHVTDFVLALVLAWLFLANFAHAGEQHVMAGYMQGLSVLGSPTPEPSSPTIVAGWTSDPVILGARAELEFQAMTHWQGLATSARWDLGDRWHVLAGTGAGVLNAGLDWQSDGFNFLLQAGVGYRVGDWRADVRWHHVSNARLRQPNRGTNGVLFLLGRTW